jgi:hypothetical protein
MTNLAQAMLIVFIAMWCAGVTAWLYLMRYFMPLWWAGITGRDRPKGYAMKALRGAGAFLIAGAGALAAGGVAEWRNWLAVGAKAVQSVTGQC